jgi:NAD(P)-dependent dehydrogenase (short-subunit alcohol dehydrogenase family)
MQASNHDPASKPVVVITGASAGVGRATARAFADRGARIALLARGMQGLEATKKEVEERGSQAILIQTDVADAAAVERAASETEDAFGPIDIWINNAMVTVYGELQDIEPEEYRRVTDVCYHGTVHGTMSALKRMLPRDAGHILQVGSALAYRGIPLQAPYCGSQHAIQGMFDSLRAELFHRKSNVTTNMVQLPALNTPQFEWGRTKLDRKAQPVPPIYQPEIAADAIVYAATDGRHRRELYVGYPSVQVIVGNKLAPGLADRYLARSGYEDQMRDEPLEPGRLDNLFEPVDGDHGAHGPFDEQAKDRSPQWWASKNRRWVGGAVAGIAGLVGAALVARR